MPAMHLRPTFHCRRYSPYINDGYSLTDHLRFLEQMFFLSFVIQLYLAIQRKRVGTLIGILLFAIVIETFSFLIRSHAHAQFYFQLTCFLPLKEILWYVNSMFAGLLIAESFSAGSVLERSLLAATLSILHDIPYELINVLDRVDSTYLNELDFFYARLSEKLSSASVIVIISYFLLSFSVSFVGLWMKDWLNPFLIPTFGMGVFFLAFTPYNLMKFLGCVQFFQAESGLNNLFMRCAQHSQMSETPILFFGSVCLGLVLLNLFSNSKSSSQAKEHSSFNVLVYASAFACHAAFFYNLIEGSELPSNQILSLLTIQVSACLAHFGLMYLALSKKRDGTHIELKRAMKSD